MNSKIKRPQAGSGSSLLEQSGSSCRDSACKDSPHRRALVGHSVSSRHGDGFDTRTPKRPAFQGMACFSWRIFSFQRALHIRQVTVFPRIIVLIIPLRVVPSGLSIVANEAIESNATIVACPFSIIITPILSKRALLPILKDASFLEHWTERQLIIVYICFHWIARTE